jgi:hypothetical protein
MDNVMLVARHVVEVADGDLGFLIVLLTSTQSRSSQSHT